MNGADVALEAIFAAEGFLADFALIRGFPISVDQIAMPREIGHAREILAARVASVQNLCVSMNVYFVTF